jgi:hypothetical protein
MIDIKELMERTAKLINENVGRKIEFRSETFFTKYGERFHSVKFEGECARIHSSLVAMLDFHLPKEEANRMAELVIRSFGIAYMPTLTVYEEFELSELQQKFEDKQNDFGKRLNSEIKVNIEVK